MVASNFASRKVANGHSPAVRVAADGGQASLEELVDDAERLTLRAPELALVLGERAASLAENAGSDELWVRAESSVVRARVTVGYRASTVARAVAALRSAEHGGHDAIAARLRTDLAVCSRSLGAPLTGLAALRPVLTVGGLSSIERATALTQLVGCLGTLGRKAELDRVLLEGDRLIASDERLDDDGKLLGRALLRVGASGHRRRHRDLVGAADAARMGIDFLDQLREPTVDPGRARVRLVLELVCSLLDRGETEAALEIAEPTLAVPERAASVAPGAWLRLAIATRVHAQRGEVDAAGCLLRDAVHSATRHGLYPLAARLWLELATLEEQVGVASEALRCLRNARAAEHKASRVRSQARALLVGEFGSGEQAPVDLAAIVGSASRTGNTTKSAAVGAKPVERVAEQPVSNGSTVNGVTSPAVSDATLTRGPAHDEAPIPEPAAARPERPNVVLPMLRLAPEPVEPNGDGADGAVTAENTEPLAMVAEQAVVDDTAEPADDAGHTESRPVEVSDAEPVGDEPVVESTSAGSAVSAVDGAMSEVSAQVEAARPVEPEAVSVADTVTRREPERSERARTRHDSEHGSVAAKSVLDRLGISTGGSGGRRRAGGDDSAPAWGSRAGDDYNDAPAAMPLPPSTQTPPDGGDTADTEADRTNAQQAGGDVDETDEAAIPTSDKTASSPAEDFWLPRLSLPPSLAPLEDLDSGSSQTSPATSSTPEAASSPHHLPSDVPLDDPPADAGLADLLARALAEHQAGSRSASALVKQLGADGPEGTHRANGRRHRDS